VKFPIGGKVREPSGGTNRWNYGTDSNAGENCRLTVWMEEEARFQRASLELYAEVIQSRL